MSRSIFIAAAIALAVTLPAVSAQAQAPRTFVSAAGSDSNPCSFAAPCRHFQAAVNATSLGGEVDALDPAGYGPIIISQAVTIEGQGWSYIAPPVGGNGITVNAVSGNVVIHGVSLNGVGIAGNTNGIQFNSGGSLKVADSVMRNFSQSGIFFQPSASTSLFVADTLLTDNFAGVQIRPIGAGAVTADLNRVQVNNNNNIGIEINALFGSGGSITANVSESNISGNGSGIAITSTTGHAVANVTLFHSVVANSPQTGIAPSGTTATLTVAQSVVTGNVFAGWDISLGAVLQTYQDNYITGNGANVGTPTNVGKL